MKTLSTLRPIATLRVLALASGLAAAGHTLAQAPAPESAPAFSTFNQWVETNIVTVPLPAPASVDVQRPAAKGGAAAVRFEPLPVIVGVPELPLLGAGARAAARSWDGGLNYQGVHARFLLINDKTKAVTSVPLSTRLAPGQRFKIRLAATFDGVASLDQILGSAFDAQRSGQVYPGAGLSVEFKADKSVDLPIGENQFFVLDGRPRNERLVLSVRHAKAAGDAKTSQPAYRQESKQGSSYLQLTPRGSYPNIEQVLTSGR